MKSALPFRIIGCEEWRAETPTHPISTSGHFDRIIFHHTAGHHAELDANLKTETYAESCAYARSIQRYHMHSNGWIDSGHNFLITRSGFILEGRHGSLARCKAGIMVVSAHCPGQNGNPGIEHEHRGREGMTPIQREASIWLMANLCRWGGVLPTLIDPHRKYYATDCPGVLADELPALRREVAAELGGHGKDSEAWWLKFGPEDKPRWFFPLLREAQRRYSNG